jgi:hypothetical protein
VIIFENFSFALFTPPLDDFQGGPVLPDMSPRAKRDRANKESIIGRFATISTMRREAPDVLVCDVRLQNYHINQVPEPQILH